MGSLSSCVGSRSHGDNKTDATTTPYRKYNMCNRFSSNCSSVYHDGHTEQGQQEQVDTDMPRHLPRNTKVPGTFALLVVAAAHTLSSNRSSITFRVMLHVYNSPQAASFDDRRLYYDPDMVEVKRKIVNLGYRNELRVETELILEEETEWRHKEAFPSKQERKSQGFLFDQSSENLADFCLEAEADALPLSGHIKVTFCFPEPHIEKFETVINMDYPSEFTPIHRVSQAQNDLLNEIFITIAREIGDKSSELAVCLGVTDYHRHEIASKSLTAFDKNFEMLRHWWKTSPETATVEKLIQVLVDCGRKDLAETARHKSSLGSHKGSVTRYKIVGHKTNVMGRKTSVAGRKASVTGRKGSVAGRKGSVAGRKTSVAGRKASVTGRKGSVAGRKGSVAGRKGSVAGRKGSVAGRKGSVAGRKGSVAGHKGSVAGRKGSVAGRKGSVAGRKGSVAGRKGSVAGRKGSVTGRKGSVTGRKGSVAGRKESVAGRKESVIGQNSIVTGRKMGVLGHNTSVPDIDVCHKNSASGHRNRLTHYSSLHEPQDTFIPEEDERPEVQDMGNEEPMRKRRSSHKKALTQTGQLSGT